MRKNPTTMKGRIERCWLFTFRTPEDHARALLPKPLDPVTREGWGFWNVVVCRVEAMRPRGLPAFLGMGYWHVAYRLYARFGGEEGLHFLRSDCDSGFMAAMGNVMTDFNFHKATVEVREEGDGVGIAVDVPGGTAEAALRRRGARRPEGSLFASLDEAAAFLKYQPRGFSVANDGRVNVVRIVRDESAWRARPVEVVSQRWEFFRGKEVVPEICTEVDPIGYRWNRGELVEATAC